MFIYDVVNRGEAVGVRNAVATSRGGGFKLVRDIDCQRAMV